MTRFGDQSLPPGHSWIRTTISTCKGLCDRAIAAGHNGDGNVMYIGRANHLADLLPAKVIPQKNLAYVCYGGKEIEVKDFELLVRNEYKWVPASDGNVPSGAVPGGKTSTGEILYVGRVKAHGHLTVGKIQPSHRCCYIPFFGKEESHKSYEVLVIC